MVQGRGSGVLNRRNPDLFKSDFFPQIAQIKKNFYFQNCSGIGLFSRF
jgi:hypothetical protein